LATTPHPTAIRLKRAERVLEVEFDSGETFRFSCEFLRVHSPSAEVQGHGPGQRVLQVGKEKVGIRAIEPVGNYGVLLRFDDGHETGIYSWSYLLDLGQRQPELWQSYLAALAAAGHRRDE
jgi:DUF971 family protein